MVNDVKCNLEAKPNENRDFDTRYMYIWYQIIYIYIFEGLKGGNEMVKLCNYTIVSEKLFQLIGVKSPFKIMKTKA